MSQRYTEQYIAEQLSARPEKAFQVIYELYAHRLLAIAFRYVADSDLAKDLLQEAICKAYQARGSFRYEGEGSLLAWLRRIIVNETLNHLKSFNTRVMERYQDDQEIEGGPINEEKADEALSDISPDVLMALIAELPEGYRIVLCMYALEGYSHKEIAKYLGIKERSSSSQYHRAKQELKRKIIEWRKENQ